MSDVIDILTLGVVVVGGVIVYQAFNSQDNVKDNNNNTGGGQWEQPDQAYPNHPFHGTILDPVYDAGWNTMAWLRSLPGAISGPTSW
jgi:hypothetical protein